MKSRFFLLLVALIPTIQGVYADIRDDIIPSQPSALSSSSQGEGTGALDNLLDFVKDSIFMLMALIAIGVFLRIWGRLILARGNPEEFKKAWMQFVYAIIWIFLVAFAWAAVRFVVWFNV